MDSYITSRLLLLSYCALQRVEWRVSGAIRFEYFLPSNLFENDCVPLQWYHFTFEVCFLLFVKNCILLSAITAETSIRKGHGYSLRKSKYLSLFNIWCAVLKIWQNHDTPVSTISQVCKARTWKIGQKNSLWWKIDYAELTFPLACTKPHYFDL